MLKNILKINPLVDLSLSLFLFLVILIDDSIDKFTYVCLLTAGIGLLCLFILKYHFKDDVKIEINDKYLSDSIKRGFMMYFDGGYEIPAKEGVSNTYQMGICGLDYNEQTNTLLVYLRRPGLLIGKGGRIIKDVEKTLNVKIDIKEIIL